MTTFTYSAFHQATSLMVTSRSMHNRKMSIGCEWENSLWRVFLPVAHNHLAWWTALLSFHYFKIHNKICKSSGSIKMMSSLCDAMMLSPSNEPATLGNCSTSYGAFCFVLNWTLFLYSTSHHVTLVYSQKFWHSCFAYRIQVTNQETSDIEPVPRLSMWQTTSLHVDVIKLWNLETKWRDGDSRWRMLLYSYFIDSGYVSWQYSSYVANILFITSFPTISFTKQWCHRTKECVSYSEKCPQRRL